MTDKSTVNLVIVILGIIATILVAGAIFLTFQEKAVPGELWTLAGGAVGAFSSMLARTSSGGDAQEVQVVNSPAEPVPVDAGQVTIGGIVVAILIAVLILWLLGVRL